MALVGNGLRLAGNPGRYKVSGLAYAAERVISDPYGARKNFFIGDHAVQSIAGSSSAWTFGSSIMATFVKSAGASYAPVTTGDLTAGEVGILQISFDNVSTAIGDNNEVTSVTDAAGNTWLKAREYTYSAGAAGDGCTVSVWYTKATSTLTSGSAVTINFSGSIVAKVALLNRFTLSNGGTVTVVGSSVETQNGVDPGSMVVNPSSGNREHLFYRGVALEGTLNLSTGTAGYTLTSQSSTAGGISNSNIWGIGEWRIFTGSSDTSDPSLSNADNASVFIAFDAGTEASLLNIANKSGSQPSGTGHPYAWFWAIKAGGLASRNMMMGEGALTSDLYLGKDLESSLTGTGTINSADAVGIASVTASLAGSGDITSDCSILAFMISSLTGVGAITSDLVGAAGLDASLSGSGVITSDMNLSSSLSATLTGTGTITSDLTLSTGLSATLSGIGTIAGDLIGIASVSSSLAGSGSITSSLTALAGLTASLAGSGTITAVGSGILEMSANLTVTASVEFPSADEIAYTVMTYEVAAGVQAQAALASIANVPTDVENAAAVMAALVEGGFSLRQTIALMAAAVLGESEDNPSSPKFKGLDGITIRVRGDVNEDGDRSNVVLTP